MDIKGYYKIAGHQFCFIGEKLNLAANQIAGFSPFAIREPADDTLFTFIESEEIPPITQQLYSFEYEGISSTFGTTANGYILEQKPSQQESFYMWCQPSEKVVYLSGNWLLRLYRFAMWLGYGLMTLPYNTLAIHSSCVVHQDKAVLFLGESGTGKSTHTGLWLKHIDGTSLLNDDSPIIRAEDGKIWVNGSAWSGKTPCYKNERYELKACVRLSQAPHNRMRRLSILEAYGAIHPSCAPEFAYDEALYDQVSQTIEQMLRKAPFYHLECLPNRDAAKLSCETIFSL